MTTWLTAFAALSVAGSDPKPLPTTPGDAPFTNPLTTEGTGEVVGQQPPILQGLDVHEHLGAQLPLDLQFRDSNGKPFRFGDALHKGRPAILTLVYYDCPMMCSLILDQIVRDLSKLSSWKIGKDYDLVTVSFNPGDSTERGAEKRRGFLQALGASDLSDGVWPFLTGDSDSTKKLAQAVGFDYRYDEQAKTFAHNAVIFALTPDGKISRYLYGVTFDPMQVRLALTEAGQGKAGSSFDRFLFACYHYDPATRRYGSYIARFLQAGGLLILLGLTALLARLFWREKRSPSGARPPRGARAARGSDAPDPHALADARASASGIARHL